MRHLPPIGPVWLLCVLLLASGCGSMPSARDAHNVARAGVVSIAAAVRIVRMTCLMVVQKAAEDENLTPADVQRAMHVGSECHAALETAGPIVELAAQAVDAGEDFKAACAVQRATDALAGAIAEVRGFGGEVPWVVDQALEVGKFAGAACRL